MQTSKAETQNAFPAAFLGDYQNLKILLTVLQSTEVANELQYNWSLIEGNPLKAVDYSHAIYKQCGHPRLWHTNQMFC